MGRPLRHLPHPYAPVEVTIKTIAGMRLLSPSPELNDLIVGIFGRALTLYDVRLHDLIVFGNHIHYIVSPRDALALARFMNFVHGNIAREVGKLVGWRGKLWGRRGRTIPIVDDGALVARLRYLYEHGVKEGFVTSPTLWPGVSSVKARLAGEPLRGTWYDRTAEHKARRRGKAFDKDAFATPYEVVLSPAPCWSQSSDEEYRARVQQMVRDIEAVALEEARAGKRFLGVDWVEAQDRFERPAVVSRSPAPLCHASSKDSRTHYRLAYRAFVEAFRKAAAELVAGVLDAAFPEGSFPRPRPFVTPADPLVAT